MNTYTMTATESTSVAERSTVSSQTILVVDDDPDILNLLVYILEREGFGVLTAENGVEAMDILSTSKPDLMVLDIMMPKMDGKEVCQRVREDPVVNSIPILMLTAMTEEDDEVDSLEVGADDFLPKPIAPRLVLSHVRALLRRASRDGMVSNTLRFDDLEINRDKYIVTLIRSGIQEELHMPRKEFELLYFLASHPGRVFSRQELLDHVWGSNVYVVDRTIDVHVRKIREKLGQDYIETIKGVGYRFRE